MAMRAARSVPHSPQSLAYPCPTDAPPRHVSTSSQTYRTVQAITLRWAVRGVL